MKNFLILSLLFSLPTLANIHEEDIAGPAWQFLKAPVLVQADRVETTQSRDGKTHIDLLIEKKGAFHKVDLKLTPLCQKGESTFNSEVELVTDRYQMKNKRGNIYKLLLKGPCGQYTKMIFNHDSINGQAMGVVDILQTALGKFKAIDRLSFWSRKLNVVWPGDGDYYSWGTLNVTKGHYWDVVGHELGHAIYDMADIGHSRGGSHRIDECYSEALALSEGWASFFSAWLKVDLDDSDAKFEYMVARRAPLEIENVPSDVCVGPTNEWRVYSFLWDLIDRNQDNEDMDEAFQKIWDSTLNKNFASITKMKEAFQREYDPVLVNLIWEQNIMGR